MDSSMYQTHSKVKDSMSLADLRAWLH